MPQQVHIRSFMYYILLDAEIAKKTNLIPTGKNRFSDISNIFIDELQGFLRTQYDYGLW